MYINILTIEYIHSQFNYSWALCSW